MLSKEESWAPAKFSSRFKIDITYLAEDKQNTQLCPLGAALGTEFVIIPWD